jgi:predicted phage terminase large subunit-like protein
MTAMPSLSKKEIEEIKHNRAIRQALAGSNHYWFFVIYLGHYIKYPFAPFHHEMFRLTEDSQQRLTVLVAFRGSGKSTLMTLSYVIWSVIGVQKKKFVLILSQTQAQAKLHLANVKRELESNELLKADIGPFEEISDEWGSNSIVVSKYGARITMASAEQSIRGVRHGEHRPDLVICDDVEDLTSVKTKEGRDKTFNWFSGEVLPIGDQNTKFLIVGNLLHEDSLLMRLKQGIELGRLDGKFIAYPLLDKNDNIAWSGKFKTMDDIEALKASTAGDSAWYREYLLKIISDDDRLVNPEWVHYYDEIPQEKGNDFRFTATGIDLAISQKDSADFTAMVPAKVFGYHEDLRVYILPNPVNERLDFPKTVEKAKNLSKALGAADYTKLYIEEVGYQGSLIQHLTSRNIPAEGVRVSGQDKRARLALVTHLIQQGKVLFPKKGAEDLIQQLTGFGIERHDDLADAFSLLLLKIIEIDNVPEFDIEAFMQLNRPLGDPKPSKIFNPISIEEVEPLS